MSEAPTPSSSEPLQAPDRMSMGSLCTLVVRSLWDQNAHDILSAAARLRGEMQSALTDVDDSDESSQKSLHLRWDDPEAFRRDVVSLLLRDCSPNTLTRFGLMDELTPPEEAPDQETQLAALCTRIKTHIKSILLYGQSGESILIPQSKSEILRRVGRHSDSENSSLMRNADDSLSHIQVNGDPSIRVSFMDSNAHARLSQILHGGLEPLLPQGIFPTTTPEPSSRPQDVSAPQ